MWIELLSLIFLVGAGGGGSDQVTLDELQAILAGMESAIQDVQVEYDWYLDPPMTLDDIAGTGHLRAVSRSHESFATARPFSERQLTSTTVDLEDEYGQGFTAKDRLSFNGTVVKTLRSNKAGLEGTISKNTGMLRSWPLSPMGFTILRDYPSLLSEEMAKNPNGFKIEKGIRQVNGFNAISLALMLPDGAVYKRIYLSVDHGYAPVRFAYIQPKSGELNWAVEVQSLEEVSKGIWFPMKGNIPDSNNVYEARTVQLNRGLPEEYFNIEFPLGTKVVDHIADRQYVVDPEEAHFGRLVLAIVLPLVIAGALLVALGKRLRRKRRLSQT
ncbi:MAG: hypothetical protein GXY19_10285 [Phycisphaerae bacterium]|nr:hypothetical protein [Phycisphaerae bacterium]